MSEYCTTHIGSYRSGSVLSIIRERDNPVAIATIRSKTTAKYRNINIIWRTGEIVYHSKILEENKVQPSNEPWINFENELSYSNNKSGHPLEHQEIIDNVLEMLKGN